MKVELTLKSKALEKLRYYVEECPAEISGFGKIRDVSKGGIKMFECYDIEILPQTVSGADANITMEDIAKFLTEKIRAKQNPAEYRLWWHSHATMAAFFSNTDDTTINQSSEFPYLLSLVTNKAGDYEARLDIHRPLRMTAEVDVFLESFGNERLREQIRKEIDEKVVISDMGFHKVGETFKDLWGFGKKMIVGKNDEPEDEEPKNRVTIIRNDDNHPGESDEEYFGRISGADEFEMDNIRRKGSKKGRSNLHTGMH